MKTLIIHNVTIMLDATHLSPMEEDNQEMMRAIVTRVLEQLNSRIETDALHAWFSNIEDVVETDRYTVMG